MIDPEVVQQMAAEAQEQFRIDFLLVWALKFIDRANVRCHACGFAIWSTVANTLDGPNVKFICPACSEMLCLACGCTEASPCVNSRRIPCSWSVPGFCTSCVHQIARFAYLEVTGVISSKARPYIVSRRLTIAR